ncbi:MAG: acyltransferase domain-containing protein, partial [Planctomycetes bacterium]|nr:acyltransferase domain-containing protein [Planctomycetota bacterium]
MGRDVAESSARARSVFHRANEILDFDLAALCFEGPAEELEKTDIQQPAIFVTSVALWEAFLEAGGRRELFARTGGLSLGEYTALYVAGAIDFEKCLRLVRHRGQLMQEAAVAVPGGMVTLVGADEAVAREVCDRARQADVLAPANFNCPGQIVISGSLSACKRALDIASEVGCRAVQLPVAGAFHSPLMGSAADGLSPVLSETRFQTPDVPVIANVDAVAHDETGLLVKARSEQHLAAALEQLLRSPIMRREMGERGQVVARRKYLADRVIPTLEHLYEHLVRT